MIENPKVNDRFWVLVGEDGNAILAEISIARVEHDVVYTPTEPFGVLSCFSFSEIFPSLESLIEHLRETAIHLPEEKTL